MNQVTWPALKVGIYIYQIFLSLRWNQMTNKVKKKYFQDIIIKYR